MLTRLTDCAEYKQRHLKRIQNYEELNDGISRPKCLFFIIIIIMVGIYLYRVVGGPSVGRLGALSTVCPSDPIRTC